jgi:hypothetical protein
MFGPQLKPFRTKDIKNRMHNNYTALYTTIYHRSLKRYKIREYYFIKGLFGRKTFLAIGAYLSTAEWSKWELT